MAELDDLPVHSSRLLPDVLPFPAGDVALPAHRLQSASRACGGSRKRRPAARGDSGAGAMTSLSESAAPRSRGSTVIAALLIGLPIALTLVCVAARLDIVELSQAGRGVLLFVLLVGGCD